QLNTIIPVVMVEVPTEVPAVDGAEVGERGAHVENVVAPFPRSPVVAAILEVKIVRTRGAIEDVRAWCALKGVDRGRDNDEGLVGVGLARLPAGPVIDQGPGGADIGNRRPVGHGSSPGFAAWCETCRGVLPSRQDQNLMIC